MRRQDVGGWSEEERYQAACGAALTYIYEKSELDDEAARAVADTLVTQIMREEAV